MTNIVIAGAGFGGIQAASHLEKKFKNNQDINLTLIDKREYHLFTPNLYEAATAEEEIVSVEQIKNAITLPIAEVLKGKKIKFIQGKLLEVESRKKQLNIDGKKIKYDYLVLALGSVSDFFGIEGADKHSLTLKDLPDALRIRNKIAFTFEAERLAVNKDNIRIIVAGGGYTGMEFLGELRGVVNFLAWKNQFPLERVEIEVIEAANKLVAGFDDRLSSDAYGRLLDLGIHVSLSSKITKVDEHYVELSSGDRVSYDVLVWATGIKGTPVKFDQPVEVDRKGKIAVNQYFQVKGHDNIFALGDLAQVYDAKNRPVFIPSTAQDAWHEAKYLAFALPYILQNKRPPKPYKPFKHGLIVNMGGKWALMSYWGIYHKGVISYIIDRFAHLRYYMSLVGFWRAFKWTIYETEIYTRND